MLQKLKEIKEKVFGESLIRVEHLKKIIEATLLSAYIKDERPLSLLIVAKAESGKSSTMKQYRFNKGICYMTDCTAYGITRDVLPKIVSGEVRTLMISDLLTPLSKQTKTRQSFVTFLNNLIEEGIAKITSYTTVWDKEVKANLITSITDEALRDGRRDWASLGFLSRFIMFTYSYDASTIMKIMERYSEHGLIEGELKIELPKEDVEVELPKEIADKLNPLAMIIGQNFGLYGIRAKINLRALIKALAFRNRRKTVTEDDYNELLDLYDYMNFKYNPLR